MSERPLKGKTALVTGSSSGIGLAIARALANAGARIVCHGLANADEQAEALSQISKDNAVDTKFFATDLRDVDAICTMMSAAESWARSGGSSGIDILVNNAGIQFTTSLANATKEVWDTMIAVNLSAAFYTMQYVLPKMADRGYGRVINIASVHGLVASRNKAPYVASKFGLKGLTQVAALEYANSGSAKQGGVTVNTICPGWTETALIEPQIQERANLFGGDREAGIADMLAEKQPSRRISATEEIGALALYLCSPVAHNITGTSIPIDGGWTAQ